MLLCRYTSKILLQKIIKEILIQNELLIQSQLHLKFEEKKVYYFFGRKYYFFQLQISHLTSINLLDLQSKTIVFCAKYLTNFSPIQYVYNVKSPFVVEKNNIYLKKKFLCSYQDIHELMNFSCQLPTLVNLLMPLDMHHTVIMLATFS